MPLRIEATAVQDFAALGEEWRALEAAAAELSFFQSWTWVGCLAEERYPDPVLLRATAAGRTIGLALFNRHHGRLCLAETGDPGLDAPFIEYNAPLFAAEAGVRAGADPLHGLLQAAWRIGGVRRLVLSGVAPAMAEAAGGIAFRRQERVAPRIDLQAVRAAGGDYLAMLSSNTRHQLRRSARRYGAGGALTLARAATETEALAWLDALILLHEATWRVRGKSGAFATPYLRRFHHTLVACGLARGEIDLLRIAAGDGVVGYLYNFRLRGHVSAYQSGLDHAGASPHGKPGFTCHHLAVERALAAGDKTYDFLAGDDRYKRSLANAEAPLLWVEVVRRWSLPGLAAKFRQAIGV